MAGRAGIYVRAIIVFAPRCVTESRRRHSLEILLHSALRVCWLRSETVHLRRTCRGDRLLRRNVRLLFLSVCHKNADVEFPLMDCVIKAALGGIDTRLQIIQCLCVEDIESMHTPNAHRKETVCFDDHLFS